MRILPALFLLLFSCSLVAQPESRDQALAVYLDQYNAQRASRDWATTERTDVLFSVDENNTLVAFLGEGEVRVDIDRSASDPMDGMFPLRISNATIIFTNATILFFDPTGEHHFGFTLLDEPELPRLHDEYITLFMGDGIGKRSAVE